MGEAVDGWIGLRPNIGGTPMALGRNFEVGCAWDRKAESPG